MRTSKKVPMSYYLLGTQIRLISHNDLDRKYEGLKGTIVNYPDHKGRDL